MTITTRKTSYQGAVNVNRALSDDELDNTFIHVINDPHMPQVDAAALHRSPNAVTAMFVYDTSKDSDGGAWTEKCQHTSWYNETLVPGKWLGAHASEAAARAAYGVGGDYYQSTSDGKFYKLNAGSGTTEVLRGNKAKFPKLAGIVVETKQIVLYDLTESGCPMWRVWSYPARTYTGPSPIETFSMFPPVSVAALSGKLVFAVPCTSGDGSIYVSGAVTFDIANDKYTSIKSNYGGILGVVGQKNIVADWNTAAIWKLVTGAGGIASQNANAVAMTVLPDAPLDPVTGLAVPTIAVATGGGVSVIKHNGTVVNSSSTAGGISISINQKVMVVAPTAGNYHTAYATNPGQLGSSFALSTIAGTSFVDFRFGSSAQTVSTSQGNYLRRNLVAWPRILQRLRLNDASSNNSVVNNIGRFFNSGYLIGGTRRCFLADSVVGSFSSQSLVTGNNSTFDASIGDWTAWGTPSSPTVAWDASSAMSITASGALWQFAVLSLPTEPNSTYEVSFTIKSATSAAVQLMYNTGINATSTLRGAVNTDGQALGGLGAGTYKGKIFTEASTTYLMIGPYNQAAGWSCLIDDVTVVRCDPDRVVSKNGTAYPYGTLTKSQVASNTSLVAYSGFSAANYLREPYSADLDFGTGEWSVGAWVNVPTSLPASPGNLLPWSEDPTKWSNVSGVTLTLGQTDRLGGTTAFKVTPTSGSDAFLYDKILVASGSRAYSASFWIRADTPFTMYTSFGDYSGQGTVTNINVTTDWQFVTVARTSSAADLRMMFGGFNNYTSAKPAIYLSEIQVNVGETANAYTKTAGAATISPIASRGSASGAKIETGVTGGGLIQATAYDGTTTRTVTTSAAYNTATWCKAEATYKAGKLAILVNGNEVASTNGAPLLTLNNSNAVLTIGNSYNLDAPFPGSLALLKLSATVPTTEQAQWMYEQEKEMFRDGAQCVLPDANSIVDLSYDDMTDRWTAVSTTNQSSWTGLIRNEVVPVSAGSYSKVAAASGVKLVARTTTSPGVDFYSLPALQRDQAIRDAEAVSQIDKAPVIVDFDTIGFTATTTNGSNSLTSVSVTSGTPYIGMGISGTGIPAGTTITGINGSTYYLSANATAGGTGVAMSQTTFTLATGLAAFAVRSNNVLKREGSTKDYTKTFDGFRETVQFTTSPGSATWVQIEARRA